MDEDEAKVADEGAECTHADDERAPVTVGKRTPVASCEAGEDARTGCDDCKNTRSIGKIKK